MSSPGSSVLIIGIDLAGSPRRPTGICFLQAMEATTLVVYENQAILSLVKDKGPDLVAIDAPLSLPPGRTSIQRRNENHFRACDQELRRRRIPFFPITLGPMRQLTERGIWIRRKLEERGIRVIEVYPGAAQDIWGLPRARRDLAGLSRGLKKMGLKGLRPKATADELDAATAALVGLYFLQGKAEILGEVQEGAIILPAGSKTN
jgi:predicted nuclease with RNAse H fold